MSVVVVVVVVVVEVTKRLDTHNITHWFLLYQWVIRTVNTEGRVVTWGRGDQGRGVEGACKGEPVRQCTAYVGLFLAPQKLG